MNISGRVNNSTNYHNINQIRKIVGAALHGYSFWNAGSFVVESGKYFLVVIKDRAGQKDVDSSVTPTIIVLGVGGYDYTTATPTKMKVLWQRSEFKFYSPISVLGIVVKVFTNIAANLDYEVQLEVD